MGRERESLVGTCARNRELINVRDCYAAMGAMPPGTIRSPRISPIPNA